MLGFGSRKSARAGLRAALLAGATVGALGLGAFGAGSASAALQCSGGNIEGKGSSLQTVAQGAWTTGFNEAGVCPGGPEITYTTTGSGTGMKEWDLNGTKGFINTGVSYVGTDDPPTEEQIDNIRASANNSELAVIPVAQTSIGVVAYPPSGCEVEGITNVELQRVFRGVIKNWNELGAEEGTCNEAMVRVVRKDSSGTSYQFKNYLSRMNGAELPCAGGMTWKELRVIEGEFTPNQTWPESCGGTVLSEVVRPESNGGGALVNKVNETPGGIGYSATPDIHAHFEAGVTQAIPLQNNGQVGLAEATFAAPEVGEVANCAATPYYVPPEGRRRPGSSGLNVDWSSTFGAAPAVGGTSYPICTLTYILAFHGYQTAGFLFKQYVTAHDYLREYLVATKGQEAVEANYYAPLPSSSQGWHNVLGAAQFAAAKVSW